MLVLPIHFHIFSLVNTSPSLRYCSTLAIEIATQGIYLVEPRTCFSNSRSSRSHRSPQLRFRHLIMDSRVPEGYCYCCGQILHNTASDAHCVNVACRRRRDAFATSKDGPSSSTSSYSYAAGYGPVSYGPPQRWWCHACKDGPKSIINQPACVMCHHRPCSYCKRF